MQYFYYIRIVVSDSFWYSFIVVKYSWEHLGKSFQQGDYL